LTEAFLLWELMSAAGVITCEEQVGCFPALSERGVIYTDGLQFHIGMDLCQQDIPQIQLGSTRSGGEYDLELHLIRHTPILRTKT